MLTMRRLSVCWLLVIAACGGSPTQPQPPPQPTTVTISGRVITTLTGDPVVGATLNFSGRTVTASSDGRWTLDGQNIDATLPVEVSAAGYLTRSTSVRTQTGRTDITIDLIRDGAPFLLDFYRQFVRGGTLEPIRRWTQAPRFYINVQNPVTGGELTEAERALIAATIQNAVPQATGGAFSAALIEFGSGSRTQAGYIEIRIGEPNGQSCGEATIGSNPGWVRLNYGSCAAACGSDKLSTNVIAHEVTHAMGFWHAPGGLMDVDDAPSCHDTTFSAAELYHARIAYSRQPGNMDVDRDGSGFAFLQAPGSAPVVSCFRRH